MTERRASIETGDVIPAYPYLWRWQSQHGEEEGRKNRPVAWRSLPEAPTA